MRDLTGDAAHEVPADNWRIRDWSPNGRWLLFGDPAGTSTDRRYGVLDTRAPPSGIMPVGPGGGGPAPDDRRTARIRDDGQLFTIRSTVAAGAQVPTVVMATVDRTTGVASGEVSADLGSTVGRTGGEFVVVPGPTDALGKTLAVQVVRKDFATGVIRPGHVVVGRRVPPERAS